MTAISKSSDQFNPAAIDHDISATESKIHNLGRVMPGRGVEA
jgi:hypothetical protein